MEANQSVPRTAKVLAFPVTHPCPTCGRQCSEDDLSACLRCGQQYCQQDDWTCECDRMALEMAQRAMYLRTGAPIEEPAEENVLALAFMSQQFGEVTCE